MVKEGEFDKSQNSLQNGKGNIKLIPDVDPKDPQNINKFSKQHIYDSIVKNN